MNQQYGNDAIKFECEAEDNADACLEGIHDGRYDITTVGGERAVAVELLSAAAILGLYVVLCKTKLGFRLRLHSCIRRTRAA